MVARVSHRRSRVFSLLEIKARPSHSPGLILRVGLGPRMCQACCHAPCGGGFKTTNFASLLRGCLGCAAIGITLALGLYGRCPLIWGLQFGV